MNIDMKYRKWNCVIAVKPGIQVASGLYGGLKTWIPACAGMTGRQGRRVGGADGQALNTKTYVVIPAKAGIQMAPGLPRALLPLFARCADLQ